MSRAEAVRRSVAPPTPGVSAPADKRFRRSEVRAGRTNRIGRFVVRAIAALVIVAALMAGGALALRRLFSAGPLTISRVAVSGNTRVSTDAVEAVIAGLRGDNVLTAPLDKYRARLLDSPWVADASLRRVLPSTIQVTIVERTPMAVARLGQHLYLVDHAGVIIDAFGPAYADLDLPVVDGLISTPSGGPATADAGRAGLTGRFLQALAGRKDLAGRVSQIDVQSSRDVVVLLASETALLHLGDTQFVERLDTFLQLAPTLHETLKDIDYVDLRYDERVYVKSKGRITVTPKKQEN